MSYAKSQYKKITMYMTIYYFSLHMSRMCRVDACMCYQGEKYEKKEYE